MENTRKGVLTDLWKDFSFRGLNSNKEMHVTKEKFEEHYGRFECAVYPDISSVRPYALWTDKNVVLILHESDKLGIASITRNPSEILFSKLMML